MLFQISILLIILFSHSLVLGDYKRFEEDALKALEASIQGTNLTTRAASEI